MTKHWKRGRVKLGLLHPLLGRWVAEAESPMGPIRCVRALEPILGAHYVKLTARWEFGPGPDAKA